MSDKTELPKEWIEKSKDSITKDFLAIREQYKNLTSILLNGIDLMQRPDGSIWFVGTGGNPIEIMQNIEIAQLQLKKEIELFNNALTPTQDGK